jgi:hypothetical protein
MKFIELNPTFKEQWNQIVFHSDDAGLFHIYDWLPLTEKHWNLESKSFLVEYEGKIVGVFPLQLNRKSKSLKSTYMGLGGPALINGLQEGVRKKILKAMHEHAYQIASQNGSPFLEVLLSPLSAASLQNRWQINPLVHYFYEDTSTHTWMIDLSRSDDDIFHHYADDARHSVKNAIEQGYAVSQVSSIADMERFYEIHCETRKRTGVSPHPKSFFTDFYKTYCEQKFAIIWQAKDKGGQPVAFEVTGLFNGGALYWMGCCKSDRLDSGVNYLLQHHSIYWAKQQGAKWFENGEAFPNVHEGKLRGLTLFKGKFGGELHRFYKGKVVLRHPSRVRRILDWFSKGKGCQLLEI